MELSAIYTIWLREIKRFQRDKARIIGNLATPIIWLAIGGVGLSSTFSLPDTSYLSFVTPGIIGMSLLFTSIFAGISVIADKQFGFLKEILVAPVSRTSIILGKIAGSATVSVANGILILIIAILFGIFPFSSLNILYLVSTILFMILTSTSIVSLGLIIASKLNSMEGFQLIMSFLVIPLFLLSGAFFPLQNVPSWMRMLAFFDPLMYGVDGMRASLINLSQLPILSDLAVLTVFCIIVIFISSFMFRRIGE